MTIKAPRGTHDIIGIDAFKMNVLENNAKSIFARRGFDEIRTPIFEDIALFIRSIGEQTDIVGKEMYVFEDRKGKKFALRPEGTASFVRAYIEHRLDLSHPEGRFFYSGEMFRYERPQSGRYRQFHQIGGELLGNSSPAADAEIIITAADILSAVGIVDMSICVNYLGCPQCRAKYRQVLIDYFSSKEDLCDDCKNRIEKNPLRALDCKVDAAKFTDVPHITDFLCQQCLDNFSAVQALLKSAGYKFSIDSKLVRGLDYYTGMVFEIRSAAIGSQDAIVGGGRYDTLVKDLGGQQIPAVGFALGSQRLILAAEQTGFFDKIASRQKIYVAVADNELMDAAFAFAVKISKEGLQANKNISVFPPLAGKNLTNQLKYANKISADKTIVFAKTEFERGCLLLKDMKAKTQTEIPISEI
ncbi:MAG: histidine--tRNA ligase [Elusimicrobiota bacterium]|jgi:histidyl-tRNA synthetase|nr:histidine--tRNA ligase [Elusimicrobiota bacterium]